MKDFDASGKVVDSKGEFPLWKAIQQNHCIIVEWIGKEYPDLFYNVSEASTAALKVILVYLCAFGALTFYSTAQTRH